MAQVYFHCSNASGMLLDRRGTVVDDLGDACQRAAGFVRTLLASPTPEDWREWTLHISDESGDEILAIPYATELGRSN